MLFHGVNSLKALGTSARGFLLLLCIGAHDPAGDARLLLRARHERPRDSRAAERGQQFPPSDGNCHAPLPCEVRKGNNALGTWKIRQS